MNVRILRSDKRGAEVWSVSLPQAEAWGYGDDGDSFAKAEAWHECVRGRWSGLKPWRRIG